MARGIKIVDANGVALAWVDAQDDLATSSRGSTWLTSAEAWRIANGISKLPELLSGTQG